MVRAYLDESEEPGRSIYAVGGFVGKPEVWDDLQPKWLAALPAGITHFHSTDCFTGNNEFKGTDIPERIGLLDKLTDLILGHHIFLLAGTVLTPIFKEFAPKKFTNDFGGNVYTAPLEFAVQNACHSMDDSPIPRDIDGQCSFFMESNQYAESAKRKMQQLRDDPNLWWRARIGKDSYGTKAGPASLPMLQVADLGAFLSAKAVAKAPQGRIEWWPYLEKLTKGNRVFGITHLDEKSLRVTHAVHKAIESGDWSTVDKL